MFISNKSFSYQVLLVFILLTVLFVALRIPFLNQEYGPEEPLWVTAGEGVARTGYPLASIGETKKELPAYWKPPMLPLLLGGSYTLFGFSEFSSRLVPLVFSFLQLFIIMLLSRRIFGASAGDKIGLFAIFILAISPFAIQNSTYIETDGGILTFFLLLLLYLTWPLLRRQKVTWHSWLLVGVVGFLAIMTRVETTLMVFVALLLLSILWFRSHQSWLRPVLLILLFVTVTFVFIFAYGAYNQAFSHPEVTDQSISMILASLKIRSAPAISAAAPLNINTYLPGLNLGSWQGFATLAFPGAAFVGAFVAWITLGLGALFIYSVFSMLRKRNFTAPPLLYLVITAVITFLPFAITGTGANWPRHVFISFVLLVILSSYFILKEIQRSISLSEIGRLFLLGLVFLAAFRFTFVEDILFLERIRSVPLLLAISGGASILLGMLLVAFKNMKLLLTLFVLFIVSSFVIVGHDVATDYTLTAYYGNSGYKEAGLFLNHNVGLTETVWATDTIGYYSQIRYYDISDDRSMEVEPDWIAVYNITSNQFGVDQIKQKRRVATFGSVDIYH